MKYDGSKQTLTHLIGDRGTGKMMLQCHMVKQFQISHNFTIPLVLYIASVSNMYAVIEMCVYARINHIHSEKSSVCIIANIYSQETE